MKRLVVTLLFGLAALPGPARAEEPIGCALTSAPLMAQPDGSILIGCAGGLTDPFGEQLVNVLNKMLQSRLDPQAVPDLHLVEGNLFIVSSVAHAPSGLRREAQEGANGAAGLLAGA